jgi:hypothetical protein
MPRYVLFIIDDQRIDVADEGSIDKDYQKFVAVLNKILRGKFILEGSEALWNAKVFDGVTLTELLCGEHRGKLDRDLRVLLLQIMSKVHFIDTHGMKSREYAEKRLKNGVAAGLVVSSNHEKVEDSPRKGFYLHFIGSEAALTNFHRAVPANVNYTENEFREYLSYAFPRLFFHEKLDMGKFDEKYPAIREKLLNALAYLNDRFCDALGEWGNQPEEIERDFKVLSRSEGGIGKETSKTMRTYGRQREVTVRRAKVPCEWYIELRPHVDRVYFAYDEKYKAAADGRIVVGIFVDRLDM